MATWERRTAALWVDKLVLDAFRKACSKKKAYPPRKAAELLQKWIEDQKARKGSK